MQLLQQAVTIKAIQPKASIFSASSDYQWLIPMQQIVAKQSPRDAASVAKQQKQFIQRPRKSWIPIAQKATRA